jgi:multidrug efflux pump subunit AcrA (membrane-fusion protein)
VKIIQPLETGVVKTIFIKEGQHVKAGDKLIALDNTSNVADADRLANELTGYKEDLARQLFFLEKLDLVIKKQAQPQQNIQANSTQEQAQAKYNADFLLLPLNQQSLLASSWQEYQSKLNSFTSEITKLTAEKKSRKIDVGRFEKTLPLVIEREQSYHSLLEISAVSRSYRYQLSNNFSFDARYLKSSSIGFKQIASLGTLDGTINYSALTVSLQAQMAMTDNSYIYGNIGGSNYHWDYNKQGPWTSASDKRAVNGSGIGVFSALGAKYQWSRVELSIESKWLTMGDTKANSFGVAVGYRF